MKCWIDKLSTEEDSFWGISEEAAYALALKLGYFIGLKRKDIDFSHAKAFVFVGKAPKYTKYSFLNIAIAFSLGCDVVGEAPGFRFVNPKYGAGHIFESK